MEFDKRFIKVLVVDDNIKFANDLSDMIRSFGYTVSMAFSPLEARNFVRQQTFHFVFVDCLMPEMDGYSLAKEMEKDFSGSVKVFLMSGVFSQTGIHYMDSKNILSMFKKPMDSLLLEKELEYAISRSMSYSKGIYHLSYIICDKYSTFESIFAKIQKEVKFLSEGDVLLLFFYLLYTKANVTLRLFDHTKSIEIGLKDGSVTHFSERDDLKVVEYFSKKDLLSETEVVSFLRDHGVENVNHLVSEGLISPHHYEDYVKHSVKSGIQHFSQKQAVRFNLEYPQSNNDALEEDISIEMEVDLVHFIEPTADFVQNNLSTNFLNKMMESLSSYKLHIDEEKMSSQMRKKLDILNPVYHHIENLNSSMSFGHLFSMYPDEKEPLYRALFWLLSNRALTITSDLYAHLGKVYIKRYEHLYNALDQLSVQEVFKFLGCPNVSDTHQLKQTYTNYIKNNHVDLFSYYAKEVREKVENCNQLVIDAYNTISNKERMSSYKKSEQIKKAEHLIEVESLRISLAIQVQYYKYEKSLQILEDMRKLSHLSAAVEYEVFLWETIIEIEKSKFQIKESRLEAISPKVSTVYMKPEVPVEIFLYTSCLIEVCNKQIDRAIIFCNKAIAANSKFYLAQKRLITLQELGYRQNSAFKKISGLFTEKKKAS